MGDVKIVENATAGNLDNRNNNNTKSSTPSKDKTDKDIKEQFEKEKKIVEDDWKKRQLLLMQIMRWQEKN